MLWFSSEQIVRSIGANLANFRKSSQQFAIDNPEAFAGLPMWDTIHDGLEITPITIPVTPESFGAVHGDLHPGNFVIDTENAWAMSILDFDGAQKGWYMVDLGSIAFEASLRMYNEIQREGGMSAEVRLAYLNQFKFWLTDSYAEVYGSPVIEEELIQGCQYRKDFIYIILKKWVQNKEEGPTKIWFENYINDVESGDMPVC